MELPFQWSPTVEHPGGWDSTTRRIAGDVAENGRISRRKGAQGIAAESASTGIAANFHYRAATGMAEGSAGVNRVGVDRFLSMKWRDEPTASALPPFQLRGVSPSPGSDGGPSSQLRRSAFRYEWLSNLARENQLLTPQEPRWLASRAAPAPASVGKESS